MAVARNGSIVNFPALSNANSGSNAVTVPSGTTLALAWFPGYITGGAGALGTPEAAPTLGGVTGAAVQGNDNGSFLMGYVYRFISPASGSQTIAWDWGGTAAFDTGPALIIAFYTGSDTTTPIGATDETSGASSGQATSSLANSSGDLVVGFLGFFSSGTPAASFTGATLVQIAGADQVELNDSWAAYAETAGTGSGISITGNWTNGDDGLIVGVVIKANAAASTPDPFVHRKRMHQVITRKAQKRRRIS